MQEQITKVNESFLIVNVVLKCIVNVVFPQVKVPLSQCIFTVFL